MADSQQVEKGKGVGNAAEEESQAPAAQVESENDDEGEDDTVADGGAAVPATSAGGKKKKSKRKRIKAALGGSSSGDSGKAEENAMAKMLGSLNNEQIGELLSKNPALAQTLGINQPSDLAGKNLQEMMKNVKLADMLTGMASSEKNVKDMANYKFWGTQPVPKFGESSKDIVEGPFKIVDPEKVPQVPGPLVDGFEWVTMDITNDEEIEEVYTLLCGHYVEDDSAMFRFNYSKAFLRWALMAPGWTKEWHIGVRATASRKLVAFISAIPVSLRVRKKVLKASEVNFLCVHKKLRSKRLAPVLIKEVTRRCYIVGVFQAIYTAGVVLPTPVATCRYYHRSLDWQKLSEIGFSHLPPNSKPSYQVMRYKLPENTATKGLRPMEARDVDAVLSLLQRYLAKFDTSPIFTRDEVEHWLLHKKDSGDQVVWSYVVENPSTKTVTDFFSFYCLESSVINNKQHSLVRAAYMFYYASESALPSTPATSSTSDFSTHLNALINDALILAKKYKFDVFNALTLMDNNLFLNNLKFGAGDGQLHYYLYNYNANQINGGLGKSGRSDEGKGSGVGVVML